MVEQLQMVAWHVACKTRNALPVQRLCIAVKNLSVVFVKVSGCEGKRPVPEDLLQPIEALSVAPHEGHGLRTRFVLKGQRQSDLCPALAGKFARAIPAPLVEVLYGEWEKRLR